MARNAILTAWIVVKKSLPLSWVNRIKQKTDLLVSFLFWWERVDSDHRSRRQQIYSLPPLATREHSHIQFALLKSVELVDGLEPPTC